MKVERKIGGTKISQIFGLSRWGGPMDAYLSLTGIIEDEVNSEAAYWGKESQPAILRRYNKESGHNMELCDITYAHPKYEFITWTPDCLEKKYFAKWPKSNHIAELKQTSIREQYGEPGTDEVSDETGLQCQLYMGCCEAQTCDVAVHFLRPRHEFAIYHLKFNQDIFDNIIQVASDFYYNHVIPQIPPPVDASEGSKKLLNYLYPRETEDLLETNEKIDRIAQLLKTKEEMRDKAVEDLTLHQNMFKEIIGDHAGIQTSLGKITWKKSKDKTSTDWMKAYFDLCEYCQEKGLSINDEDFSGKHTKIIPGSRIFRSWWKKEEA